MIAEELVATEGDVCAIGAVCKARGIDVSGVDYRSPEDVAATVGIASQMVAEIEYEGLRHPVQRPASSAKLRAAQ